MPSIGEIAFSDEDTDNQNRAGAGGTLGNLNITLPTGVAQVDATLASMNDVPNLQESVATASMRGAAKYSATKLFAALKASVNSADAGTFMKVKTGVANALPAAPAIMGRMDALIEAVPAAYRSGCSWHLSRQVEKLLHDHTASGGDYAFQVEEGIKMFRGYPVQINDSFEDGNADNEVSAAFANFFLGLIQVDGSPMLIARAMMETKPGRVVFFSSIRSTGVVQDGNAIAGLVSGA